MLIAGLLIRNFKIYKNIHYVPFIQPIKEENLHIFIGNNGSGKSSILEAMNAFFNEGKWIPTTSATAKDVFVCVVLLIEKAQFDSVLNSHDLLDSTKKISDFFWSTTTAPGTQEFIAHRDELKSKYGESHYLLVLGNCYADRKNLHFGPFDRKVKTEAFGYEWNVDKEQLNSKTHQNVLNKYLEKIRTLLTFIYIPAETNIADFLKLESDGMQELVNRTIKEEIELILDENHQTSAGEKNILDLINDKLKPYVASVESTIQSIDPEYKFNEGNRPSRLYARDLISPIIKVYYSKRRLEKSRKPIGDLSSGERKKALIDIIYSFLSQEGPQEKIVVFAIDEPEASLDSSKRYDSFDRINKIANFHKHQTFITTHWYGLLPIAQSGHIYSLVPDTEDNKPNVRIYDAQNFISVRAQDPDDDYFKSFNDLSMAIVSSLRNTPLNWLIVEGPDDKNYLEYYLKNEVTNVNEQFRVLCVGGAGNVKLMYEHLFIPINKTKGSSLKGRVLCLVDTDENVLETDFPARTKNNRLAIKKIMLKDNTAQFVNLDHPFSQESEMEDILEPEKFYVALKAAALRSETSEIIDAINRTQLAPNLTHSRLKGDESVIEINDSDNAVRKQTKEILVQFASRLSSKYMISEEYCKLPYNSEKTPDWVKNDMLPYFFD